MPNTSTRCHLQPAHCELWKYYQSTSKVHAKVLQDLNNVAVCQFSSDLQDMRDGDQPHMLPWTLSNLDAERSQQLLLAESW